MAVQFQIKSTRTKDAYVRVKDNNGGGTQDRRFPANDGAEWPVNVQGNSPASPIGDVKIDIADDEAEMNKGNFETERDGDIADGEDVTIT
jgi:hypothetical protein